MDKLLRNERLKLYKKVSTWVLLGLVVAWSALNIILPQLGNSSWKNSWRDDYTQQIQSYQMIQQEEDDAAWQVEIDRLRYHLDHDIDPLDWRADPLQQYYSLKYDTNAAEPAVQQQLDMLMQLIEQNDWKSYIHHQMDEVEQGQTGLQSSAENAVRLEVLQLYLDYDVAPTSQNNRHAANHYTDLDTTNLWKNEQLQSIESNRLSLLRGEDPETNELLTATRRSELQQEIDIAIKRLSTGCAPLASDSFLGLMESSTSALTMISILLIVLAGGIVSSEFSAGTVKLLLITPHKRQKVFWSKALLMLEITLMAMVGIFVVSFVCSGIMAGFAGIGDSQVISLFGHVVKLPYLLYIVLAYVLSILPVVLFGTVAFMLSTITRKGAVAIAVTFLLMYGGQIFMELLTMLVVYRGVFIPGLKFIPFASTDLLLPTAIDQSATMYYGNSSMPPIDSSITLGFQVVMLLIYTVCLLWIARDSFCRRDVK